MKNHKMIFMEQCYRLEPVIKVKSNGRTRQIILTSQQCQLVDYLISKGVLNGTEVEYKDGKYTVIRPLPQTNFLDLIKEDK